jgi:glycosyltransferase involved in cell wall biosynthesis
MCLAHLENQTHPAARFEVVVVDLGSTDGTSEVLERYAAGAPVRITVLRDESGNAAAARNLGLDRAQGAHVLFLSEDLLAGPRLVENHLAAQRERGGGCAIVGAVRPHPDADASSFALWNELGRFRRFVPNQPLRFPDWRALNLSLPRQEILDAGGFDTEFYTTGMEDVELAWRLEDAGLPGFYCDGACAYAWRAATLAEKCAELYARGYALESLLRRTGADIVSERYKRHLWGWRVLLSRMAQPVSTRVCRILAPNTPAYVLCCRSVFRSALSRGYRDAAAGRPPGGPC